MKCSNLVVASICLSFSIFIVFQILPISYSQTNGTSIWKNFTDSKHNITFEYPINWTLKEKSNRFDDGPDIVAKNLSKSFNIFFPIPNDNNNDHIDLKLVASLWNLHDLYPNTIKSLRTIEGFDFDKYSIDDKQTASALYVVDTNMMDKD